MSSKCPPILFYIAISLNALAIFIGAYVYADQFAMHPLYLAIFVPDCPLYVFLTLLIVFGLVKNDLVSFIVSIGMVKYGLWTVFVLLFHSSYYFAPDIFNMSVILVLGHIGMALEGLAILPRKRLGALALVLAVGWFLLNDFSDYFLGTVPLIPPGGMDAVRNLTIASSIMLPLLLFAFAAQAGRCAPVAWLRGILFKAG